ncbi:MAG: hypothetical protein COC10_05810 [Sphingobium sp.]|nr:MAG: hypothetical protein COC10_05810 [Sphingobium sp.]
MDKPIQGPAVPRPLNWFMWASATVLGVVLILLDLMQLDGLRLSKARLIVGRDFLNVWTGGNLALSGQLDKLYDYDAYRTWQMAIFGVLDPYNYSYPPQSLFLAMPFAELPYLPALILWTVAGATFFMWAAKPYMASLPNWLAIATPAAVVNIWCGHYGFVIGALWLLFFRSLNRAPIRSGVIAGLMTLKPHLGLLIAATLIYRRKGKVIGFAIIVTLALILLSSFAFDFDLWRQWIVETSALQNRIMNASGNKFYFLMMPSAYIALREYPAMIAVIVQISFATVAIWLTWRARNADIQQFAFICATATAIILPYIFNYDLTVVSLGFAILLYDRWTSLTLGERIILWLAFASPLLVMVYNLIAPIALLAGLIVLVKHAIGSHETTPARTFAKA